METATTINPVDVAKLRAALRFVHCVQKERGATSCAVVAGGYQEPLLLQARRDTDRALHMILRLDPDSLTTERATLKKIRRLIPSATDTMMGGTSTTTTIPSFHHILACFTTLVQSVVHQFVMLHTTSAKKRYEKALRPAAPIWNSGSHGALQGSMWTEEPTHKRTSSLGFRPSSEPMRNDDPPEWRESKIDFSIYDPPETLEPLVIGDEQFKQIGEQYDVPIKKETFVSFVEEDEASDDLLLRLFNLLDTFIKLKESTGLERATLSGIFVADQTDTRFMLNDLVLEVENQRQQIAKLTLLLPKTGALHNLVAELVSLSPQMKQLQHNILQGSDLQLLRLDFQSHKELWSLLTVYIDKLHALELMILEEIECCVVDYAYQEPKCFKQNSSSKGHEEKSALLEAIPGSSGSGETKESSETGMSALLEQLSMTATPSKEWGIDIYEIRFLRRIGEGSAGTTYLAVWQSRDVAVKVASINGLGLEGWQTEVQTLQKLHHPNVIRLLGSVYRPQPPTFCLVLEHCDAGDLGEALQRSTPPNFFFCVAAGVAKAMAYLHHRGIIHRDIKPGNILLHGDLDGGRFEVKLTDFGMATESGLAMERSGETGTYRWMAPEVIRHENYSQPADVFSYAIVLWQLLTREHPYMDIASATEAAAGVALEDKRPPLPKGTPVAIAELITQCWNGNPDARPSFDHIITVLEEIEQGGLSHHEKIWIGQPHGNSAYTKVTTKKETKASPGKNAAAPKKRRGLFNRKSVHF